MEKKGNSAEKVHEKELGKITEIAEMNNIAVKDRTGSSQQL